MIDSLLEGVDFRTTITRARFEELNRAYFERAMVHVEEVLVEARKTKFDVDEVVLVGGSTSIPKIRELLHEYFGKDPNTYVNPDEAVAFGATVQAATLANCDIDNRGFGPLRRVVLVDVTPLSLGIEIDHTTMSVIIKRNTTVPCTETKPYVTLEDNQTEITVKVFQGERPLTKDNILLGSFTVSGLPRLPRGKAGIQVTFYVEATGILVVTAKPNDSDRTIAFPIESSKGRLSKARVEELAAAALVYVVATTQCTMFGWCQCPLTPSSSPS
jgi:molecular chaperone DnaK (HSP70)